MKYFRRRRNSSYGDLWLKAAKSAGCTEDVKTSEEIQIETLMLRADLCEDLESYVTTLCNGMEQVLESDALLRVAKKSTHFESKIKRIGRDIIEKSRQETDLFYLGVFASLKLKENWLDKQFYKILAKLLSQVMEKGFQFSEILKRKIKSKLLKCLIDDDGNRDLAHLASMLSSG